MTYKERFMGKSQSCLENMIVVKESVFRAQMSVLQGRPNPVMWKAYSRFYNKNVNRYHRTEGFSSWGAALLRGNTGGRTRRVCCRHRSRWSCWRSHTRPARRPGCNVQGQSAGCRSSRTLNAAAAHRWFAAVKRRRRSQRFSYMQMRDGQI